MKKLIIIFIFLSIAGRLLAQNYPVEIMVSVDPPHSLHLSDYFRTGKVKFTLFMKDLNKLNYPVILQISLTHQNQGAIISSYNSIIEDPIYLSAGEAIESSLDKFLGSFDQVALNKYELLSEGYYSLCVEAIDWQTQLPVSHPHCYDLFLNLDDAPSIFYPEQNSILEAQPSQNLNISWTHFAVNFNAENIQYELFIFEKPEGPVVAVDIVNHNLPVFSTTTYSQNLFITESDLMLEPGTNYILLVQASATFSSHLFKNSGYSELVEFTYGVSCPPPLNTIITTWHDKATIDWESDMNHTSYEFNFRAKDEVKWNSIILNQNHHEIEQLIKDSTYYFQIRPFCHSQPGDLAELDSFQIEKDEISFSCESVAAAESVTNEVPNQDLVIGDFIIANGFKIQLGQINYNDNNVSGEGFIIIPYLNDARVYVEFTDIKVNTDHQLFEGIIDIRSIENDFTEKASRLADLLSEIDNYLNLASACLGESDEFDAYVNYVKSQMLLDSTSMKTLQKQIGNVKYARAIIKEAKILIGKGKTEEGSALLAEAKKLISDAKEVLNQLFGTITKISELLALLKEKIINKSDSLDHESAHLDTMIAQNSELYHQKTIQITDIDESLENQIILIEHRKEDLPVTSQEKYLHDSRLKDPLQAYNQIIEDLNRKKSLLECIQKLVAFSQPGRLKELASEFQQFLKTEIQNFNWKKLDLNQLETNVNRFLDDKILNLIKNNPDSI